ncbi:methyltransferase family protein [Micromonospora sp. Llam0]|uniref:SAM-dependent methyltransferase n=1 Tax=Micromonospora sp. Llam0 TaxID=2485143 RepID=UPI000F49B89C|nr:class I SAM-dependent methyltransferase [Micromonospora sp. Llam0]ROO61949.1 methyltransferase family protein [Micromonospora sp. Llam0]
MTTQSDTDPASFWDKLYRGRRASGGRANPLLVETVEALDLGTALDLGCGAGGDTIWLAARGWRVTAVDISGTAVERVVAAADERGVGDRVTGERHDLAHSFPAGTFDLVNAQYFHTPFALDRGAVLRTAAQALRPGGRLLIVDHGSTAPWSWNQDPDAHFPTPDEVADGLDLDPQQWRVLRAAMPQRRATGPGGQTATVTDNVLLVQRHEGTD